MSDGADYTLQLYGGGLAPRWLEVMHFASDAAALAAAGALLERQPEPLRHKWSLVVGRGRAPDRIQWLGAWHLDDPCVWVPAE